jgi:hypothetical protein
MALQEEAKAIVAKVFGPANAAKVDLFAQEINPEAHPREFIQKCVDLLSSMLGPNLAKEKFKDLAARFE